MSYFADIDIEDVPDDPNDLPNDTYKFKVETAEAKETKNKDKVGLNLKVKIVEGENVGFTINDWTQLPNDELMMKVQQKDAEAKAAYRKILGYLKQRLIGFGLSMDEIENFGPDDVKGLVNRMFWGSTSSYKNPETQQISVRIQRFSPITETIEVDDEEDGGLFNNGDGDDNDF